jgi:hypothetical protein
MMVCRDGILSEVFMVSVTSFVRQVEYSASPKLTWMSNRLSGTLVRNYAALFGACQRET